jgi:ADP-heptose:LPS heptosyltransferase
MVFETAQVNESGIVTEAPLRIYTGILGQIGDIVLFTPTVRRVKELFPNSEITFAVSARYREAGELVAGLPYVDRVFVTELYFEKLTGRMFQPWERGWPVDFRGDDEVAEERRHDIVLQTRPRHRRERWWEHGHLTEELAHMVGVPGPIGPRAEIAIPAGTRIPPELATRGAGGGKIVIHNDPNIDPRKAWPWALLGQFVASVGPEQVVLLGGAGPALPGVLDLRGRTTLAEAAGIIAAARCFIGIESGLTCIAGALQAPTVGLFGTEYVAAREAVQPHNPRAVYLQAEGGLDRIAVNDVLTAMHQVREGA